MLEKPSTCQPCTLVNISKGFSRPEGQGSIPLMMVGESLGINEMLDGLPFRPHAQAGSVLERAIRKAGYNRQQFVLTNLVRCQPPGDKLGGTSYEHEAIQCCQQYFDKEVEKYRPRALLALGDVPLRHLTGMTGKNRTISSLRGYVLWNHRYNLPVIGTFHPSHLRQGAIHLLGVMLADIKKATKLAQGELVEGRDYILEPSWSNMGYVGCADLAPAKALLETVKRNSNALLSIDIETDYSAGQEEDSLEETGNRITQIQFSLSPSTGVALPFNGDFVRIASELLESENPKCGHNFWKFDLSILRTAGFKVNGRIDDTMWMFHHIQPDLPAGLQFASSFHGMPFPWKHLSDSDFQFYGCADVDAVQRIMSTLPQRLQAMGLWKGYDRLVHDIEPILVRMSERGYPVNREKQIEFSKLIEEEREKLDKQLQTLVPDMLKGIHPKEGYKVIPREVKTLVDSFIIENQPYIQESELIGAGSNEIPLEPIKRNPKYQPLSNPKILEKLSSIVSEKTGLMLKQFDSVQRWCKLEPFNPRSYLQVLKYIKYKKHPVPKHLKTDDETTAKQELERLWIKTGDQVYKLILEIREMSTMQSRYLGTPQKPTKWVPGSDGRVHPTFLFRPANLQFSCVDPNTQQGPERTLLAKAFKKMIEARSGHKLVKFDFKSFHALMVGYLAHDKDYMRLARLDVHSYVAAWVKKEPEARDCLSWPDDQLGEFLVEMKKKHKELRDDQIKHAVHGINFGLTEWGCFERYRDQFSPSDVDYLAEHPRTTVRGEKLHKLRMAEGSRRVRDLYRLLHDLFPRVFRWQDEVMALAHSGGNGQGFLQNPFGFRRWFHEVRKYKYTSTSVIDERGEQADQAIAWLPASNSYCHKREKLLILEQLGLNEEANLINDKHDAIEMEIPDNRIDELVPVIAQILQSPSQVLLEPEPFWCDVDCHVGQNLLEMDEVKV